LFDYPFDHLFAILTFIVRPSFPHFNTYLQTAEHQATVLKTDKREQVIATKELEIEHLLAKEGIHIADRYRHCYDLLLSYLYNNIEALQTTIRHFETQHTEAAEIFKSFHQNGTDMKNTIQTLQADNDR
jgi:hypothetical protein